MKKLNDLTPGMFLYTILVKPTTEFIHIIIAKRKVHKILRTYVNIEIEIEPIVNENFSTTLTFNCERGDRSFLYKGSFRYCFSEDALMEELKYTLTLIKRKMEKEHMLSAIYSFYHCFMPKIMKMMHTNDSGYVEINTMDSFNPDQQQQ